jgi:hypothetical protein
MSDNGSDLVTGARDIVLKTINTSNAEERADWSVIKEKIRVDLKRLHQQADLQAPAHSSGHSGSLEPLGENIGRRRGRPRITWAVF